jgi:hypothetical protein
VGDVLKQQVPALADRDHLVADVAVVGIVLDDVPTAHPPAHDGEVLDLLAPHEGIVEMAVPKILILLELVRLRFVVPARRPGDDGVIVQEKPQVALQVNRGRRIRARWENDITPASRMTGRDRAVDGRRVVSHPIPHRAIRPHIKLRRLEHRQRKMRRGKRVGRPARCGGPECSQDQ